MPFGSATLLDGDGAFGGVIIKDVTSQLPFGSAVVWGYKVENIKSIRYEGLQLPFGSAVLLDT